MTLHSVAPKLTLSSEKEIQTAIEQYLRLLEQRKLLIYVKNNSGALQTGHGSFLRFGKAGSPDFLLFLPGGKTIHLEVKTDQGQQTESQKQYQQRIEDLGHQYQVVRSVRELASFVESLTGDAVGNRQASTRS